ncbi:MAG: H-X9-DG-CTERM domain-containing protein, partial [Lentisphaerota bacterium]
WYGWYAGYNITETDVLRIPCPNLRNLGTFVDNNSNKFIDTPSKQAMGGDISSCDGFITAYNISDKFPMAHSKGANAAFMDGHVAWTPRVSFKYYFYYGSAITMYWDNK